MKISRTLKFFSAVLGLALMCSVSKGALTIQSNSWTNTFPIGTHTMDFTLTSTAWWFGSWPLCSDAMTNDPSMDAQDSSSSGSLYVSIPFTGSGQQGWFFSTFDGTGGWNDGAVQIPLNIITNLSFDIYIKSGTSKDENGRYGDIEVNLVTGSSTGGFTSSPIPGTFEELTIPAAAGGAWYHMYDTNISANINSLITAGYTNAAAIAFYINNNVFGGYPSNGMTYTFWLDNMTVTTATNSLPPVAQFTMSSNIGVAPFTVTFQDTSLHSPTSWAWTFGDGGTSTSQNPSHTFTNMWRQLVTLKASNAFGNSSSTQAMYQCFPCDAVYDWTNGTLGQIATVTTLSNSLVGGSSKIGTFTVTNHDLPSPNLQGITFTNLTGMTNGCPVVFSNGVIYSNFNTTNALVYHFTNDHEQFTFHFNSGYVVTNIVWIFYDSLPLVSNAWLSAIDEASFATSSGHDSPDLGGCWLNRNLGVSPGPLPGTQNDNHTSETPYSGGVTYGSFPGPTNAYFDGTHIYQNPNKLYRILFQNSTNGIDVLAVADPVTSLLIGFVTNYNVEDVGFNFTAFAVGHISAEVLVTNTTSIQTYHEVLSINRPLTWAQVSNVVMFGP